MAEAALAAKEPPSGAAPSGAAAGEAAQIDWLELIVFRAGWLKWPLFATSLLVVAFGLERAIGLRRRKVLPSALIQTLRALSAQPAGLDSRQAYRACQQYPSAAANVVQAVLVKVGRPLAEIERVAEEASNREASRLYGNVRWLNLSAAIAPLLGLLGTVQGMIEAFFVTANLPPGANRTDFLAQGIYTALVCTLLGLSVAIPAMVLAHFYEGRIQALFRELSEALMGFYPQLERLDGRARVAKDQPLAETILSPPPHVGGVPAAGSAKRG
jgi:biopolymer transport protein ExbB